MGALGRTPASDAIHDDPPIDACRMRRPYARGNRRPGQGPARRHQQPQPRSGQDGPGPHPPPRGREDPQPARRAGDGFGPGTLDARDALSPGPWPRSRRQTGLHGLCDSITSALVRPRLRRPGWTLERRVACRVDYGAPVVSSEGVSRSVLPASLGPSNVNRGRVRATYRGMAGHQAATGSSSNRGIEGHSGSARDYGKRGGVLRFVQDLLDTPVSDVHDPLAGRSWGWILVWCCRAATRRGILDRGRMRQLSSDSD